MIFVGDVHGCYKTYEHLLFKMQHKGGKIGVECSLQLGDMGLGFSENGVYTKDGLSWSPEIDSNHKFLRGNHDDPDLCNKHPNYLGDWGLVDKINLFYVSGGYSIDKRWRTPNLNWWEGEELTTEEMEKALLLYSKSKPKIVTSHECPLVVKKQVITNPDKLGVNSRTEEFLQNMYDIHKPDYWLFGHHHGYWDTIIDTTNFICVGEMGRSSINGSFYEIKDLTWEG